MNAKAKLLFGFKRVIKRQARVKFMKCNNANRAANEIRELA